MSDDKKLPTCFIIMPITMPAHLLEGYGKDEEHFTKVLDCLLVPAVKKAGYDPIPPKAEGAVHIKAGIIKSLQEADMVLCDMSALNPNVFFELGVRTALNKAICLVRDNRTPLVPFDTNDINHHEYNSSPGFGLVQEIERIAEHIVTSAKSVENGNALWTQYGISMQAQLAPQGGTGTDAKLDYLIRRIDAFVRDIDGRVSIDAERASELREREAAAPASVKRVLAQVRECCNIVGWAGNSDGLLVHCDGDVAAATINRLCKAARKEGVELMVTFRGVGGLNTSHILP